MQCRQPMHPGVTRGGWVAPRICPRRAWRTAARAEFGLAGEEPEPGRSRIPGIDDGGAGDEVMQGAVLALHEDADEAQAEEEEAEREQERARDAAPRVEARAIRPDNAQA